jgi:dihydrofolate reductase
MIGYRWEENGLATLFFGMMQSLDGYVDDLAGTLVIPPPDEALFQHFIDRTRSLSGSFMGRGVYEFMRYWYDDRPEWNAAQRDFAAAWRAIPKWVVSRTLDAVGPNTTLIRDDLEAAVRRIKAETDGVIDVAGPRLAGAMTELGLIDEYHLYFRPVVLGGGKPFFAGPRPPLRLVSMDRLGEGAVRLIYVPA